MNPGTAAKRPRVTKRQRQHLIGQLVEQHVIHNQSELVAHLAKAGVQATQSTVSRDLEDFGAIKVRVPGDQSAYAIPAMPTEQVAPLDHLRKVAGEWIVDVTSSANLVVVRTPPGSAHVVAAALDRAALGGVLGTVAGDDTLIVVAEQSHGGARVADTIRSLANLATTGRVIRSHEEDD